MSYFCMCSGDCKDGDNYNKNQDNNHVASDNTLNILNLNLPPDPMEDLIARFTKDPSATKMNFAVGAYRDCKGKPFVLPSVRAAEREISEDETVLHEYLPFNGHPQFLNCIQASLFGSSHSLAAPISNATVTDDNLNSSPSSIATSSGKKHSRSSVLTIQTLSGTGALRLSAELLVKYCNIQLASSNGDALRPKLIYFSNPTWPNHMHIFHHHCGFSYKYYRYLSQNTMTFDFEGMMDDLAQAPMNSIVLLQVCAHNPTGIDPNEQEWREIIDLLHRRKLFPVFDAAYQGFASGDYRKDGFPLCYAYEKGMEMIIAHSFSKIMGLYGERIGSMTVVSSNSDLIPFINANLKSLIRLMYLSPPAHGAAIVARLLNFNTSDNVNSISSLNEMWQRDLLQMVERIKFVRSNLVKELEILQTPSPTPLTSWKHIEKQIGMFAFTGLNEKQVKYLEETHHLYMTSDGRLNIAAIADSQISTVANLFNEVIRHCQ